MDRTQRQNLRDSLTSPDSQSANHVESTQTTPLTEGMSQWANTDTIGGPANVEEAPLTIGAYYFMDGEYGGVPFVVKVKSWTDHGSETEIKGEVVLAYDHRDSDVYEDEDVDEVYVPNVDGTYPLIKNFSKAKKGMGGLSLRVGGRDVLTSTTTTTPNDYE